MNKMTKYNHVAVIVLAAGKGTRIGLANGINKTTLAVKGKPMIERTVDLIEEIGVGQIIVVVGHAKESVQQVLGQRVDYAQQLEQMGTGHAVECALSQLKQGIEIIIVVNGDDSHAYKPIVFEELIRASSDIGDGMVIMTMIQKDPTGLGRIIRDKDGYIRGIVEEKNATDEQKNIKEINTGAYGFGRALLESRIGEIRVNPVKGERYLTDMVEITLRHKKPVVAVLLKDHTQWLGINTLEDLAKANQV